MTETVIPMEARPNVYLERPWIRNYEPGVPSRLEYPDKTLQDFLVENARRFPDRPAVIFYNRALTYRDLERASARFAAILAGLGLQKGDRLALLLPNTPQFVLAYYGALRVGVIVVPTNPLYVEREIKQPVTFETDEGVRFDANLEAMAKLRPAFGVSGTVTAGNSSQMSDGAAAVVLMSAERAAALGLKPKAIFRGFVTTGCDPDIMGMGPALAVPKLLDKTGMRLEDIDLIELNEAFASQYIQVLRMLELDPERVNVNGGAIALGHPLGATGARQTVTIMNEAVRRKARYGIVTMCVGGGMGAAGLFEF